MGLLTSGTTASSTFPLPHEVAPTGSRWATPLQAQSPEFPGCFLSLGNSSSKLEAAECFLCRGICSQPCPLSSATPTWELAKVIFLLFPQHLQSGCSAMGIYLCVCVLRKQLAMNINGFVDGQRRDAESTFQWGGNRGRLREAVLVAWARMRPQEGGSSFRQTGQ